jgi:predicted nuclease of predicted toxin-antitoxin system
LSVELYMDHHVHSAITAGLRSRGVDCVTAEEDGAAATADEQLLQRATDLGRVLYTNDSDLLVIAAQWSSSGRPFVGVVYAEQLRITIGQAIADLDLMATATDPEEWQSRVEYLPL